MPRQNLDESWDPMDSSTIRQGVVDDWSRQAWDPAEEPIGYDLDLHRDDEGPGGGGGRGGSSHKHGAAPAPAAESDPEARVRGLSLFTHVTSRIPST